MGGAFASPSTPSPNSPPGRRMPEWLGRRALLSPRRLAISFAGRRQRFCDLDESVTLTARRFYAWGVRPGDRVALLLPNGLSFVHSLFALMRLGAIAVPINIRLAPHEIAWQLSDAGAPRLVVDEETAALGAAVQSLADAPYSLSFAKKAAGSETLFDSLPEEVEAPLQTEYDLDAPQAIIYTSGTTGRPKGAVLTYGNHWWNAAASALNLGIHAADRWLACLPLFHVGGMAILFRCVLYGIPVVIHRRFDPAAVNRAIDEERLSIVSVVTVMLQAIMDERGGRPFPATLRCLLLGGGPAPRSLLERCAAMGGPVIQSYGLTETASQVATLAPEDAVRRLGSAGKPLFPVEVRIVRDGRPLPANETGEIAVRGPTVTPGYWNRPEQTAEAIRDGWLHTGDLGYIDEDGFLYIVDRRDDLIVSGGENVYPAEIEAVLATHPAVAEAGVAGMPHERWGQAPWAAVRLREGAVAKAEELAAFCRSRLAGYKAPVRIIFLKEPLPRTASGKLLRWRVREVFRSLAPDGTRQGEDA